MPNYPSVSLLIQQLVHLFSCENLFCENTKPLTCQVFFICMRHFNVKRVCVFPLCLFRYLHRFDSELEQIELMNSIKGRQGRLHGAREAVIKQTMERERAQFEGVGFGESSLSKYTHTRIIHV